MEYPIPKNEAARLRTLEQFGLMDTPEEESVDKLAALASRLFNVPIVLVSLIGQDRQFFKARVGLDICETSRDVSFCAHAIMQEDVFVVLDALADERFSRNPLVLGPPFIRFYAGKPLSTQTGERLGTVCLIDTKPHTHFNADDRRNLADIAALVMDRMEMRRLEYSRSTSQARFENIAATSPDAIVCSNADGEITFWNRSAERLFGYTAEEILDHSAQVLVPDSWLEIYKAEIERLRNGQPIQLADQTIELSGLKKDGTEFPAEFSLSTWNEGNLPAVGAIVRDITDRKENEERLYRLASLDALTDLPNRGAWQETAKDLLDRGQAVSVLLLDLDGFKEINDTLGHSAGDAVLKEVARRLRVHSTNHNLTARLGGDEFVSLLPGNDAEYAIATAAELSSVISQPYEFAGHIIQVGVSIGISLAPQHGLYPLELLSAADLALYRAKSGGKGRQELFTPALREVANARRAFERELKKAFEEDQFELFYQPQFSTRDGTLTGAEALLRWNHPERGLLTPASFIEVLSHKPSAADIGRWILRTACKQAAEWQRWWPGFRMGVNLFEAQFKAGRILSDVRAAIADFSLPADALELEIVENILLGTDQEALTLLRSLRETGVGLAFDDYGTGYASLSLLKRFPVTRLKIDRSFIRDVHTSPEDAAVVRAILYLGRSFGMEVIAEGVETEQQMEFLKLHKCEQVQGYLMGKPLPACDFERKFLNTATGNL